ncbi:glycosyltransferase family 4 protein [Devosia salina]|uniref:Glycosyltransferase family 4 protein n=1 Tax=Devosia salina TaxID=2860336 RepID=A0ABX8WM52_9HYPH|nr:glycosyltransferase family 4 protein [Devosia salina]QYO77767.1 glycosyltransferase family 4 protein [Devosia salina]
MSGKRRLALVIDVQDWAFDNIANQVSPALEQEFEISRHYVMDHPDLATLLVELASLPDDTVIHVFWRQLWFDLLDRGLGRRAEASARWPEGEALRRLSRHVLTTSVYDHSGLSPADAARQARVLSALDAYFTASPILDEIYRNLPGMPEPVAILADGVDTAYYRPNALERLQETDRAFRIGWVGNSQWGLLEGIPDAKGLNSVIRPAIEQLQQEGLPVELRLADRAEKWMPRKAVADFYNELDALLCASLFEGTPNPVLEAMASGVPIISTDVGIVRMCLGPAQRDLIVERTPQAFAEAIRHMVSTPDLRHQLSQENLAAIKEQSWAARRPLWLSFFDHALHRAPQRSHDERHVALKRASDALVPTLKMRVRSFLRGSPRLYAAAAHSLHVTLISYNRALNWVRQRLD